MDTRTIVLLLVGVLVHSSSLVNGAYFDMSEGDPGMVSPCPPGASSRPGTWTEEDASLYETPESGPLEGKVLTSQFQTDACLRTPDLFEVSRDFTFSLYVYVPKAEIGGSDRKIQVYLVEADEGSYLITETKGPSEAGWFLIESAMPSKPGILYPELYNVEIWVFNVVDSVSIRWFGLSDEPLPPPTTTTESTTEETTTTPTTTTPTTTTPTTTTPTTTTPTTTTPTTTTPTTTTPTTTTPTTTTPTTTTPTTTTPTTTTTSKSTTTTTPRSTTTRTTSTTQGLLPTPEPCTTSFPEFWSLILGVALGVLLMSLVFFFIICCWWCFATRRRDDDYLEEQQPPLPRLEVVPGWSQGGGSQTSITGSWKPGGRSGPLRRK